MYLLCGFYIFGRKGGLLAMPRMSKKRKQEWALFLNERNRITYNELCRKCRELGYAIYDMDLITAGEEAYAAMRRSTNGGGENSPMLEVEDDLYELFFAGL